MERDEWRNLGMENLPAASTQEESNSSSSETDVPSSNPHSSKSPVLDCTINRARNDICRADSCMRSTSGLLRALVPTALWCADDEGYKVRYEADFHSNPIFDEFNEAPIQSPNGSASFHARPGSASTFIWQLQKEAF